MGALCLWLYIHLYQYVLISLVQSPTAAVSFINKNSSVINHPACHEDERQLLLQLKQELSPFNPEVYYKTKNWKRSRDCCQWDGITCDYFTRHVIALDLSNTNDENSNPLMGTLRSNSSLFHLAHLRSLNLALNDFGGSMLPSEFGRLNTLTHLNLSNANFDGEIPMESYHLSNLLSLDLSGYNGYLPGVEYTMRCDIKMLFGNMTRLRVLLLTHQNLSNSELPMNMSSFLTHLDLADTGLQGKLPGAIFEKPNLKILDLGGNDGLEGSLPKSLNWSNVHSITTLDLGWTSISGTLPDSIGLMTNLNLMGLFGCRFSGPIPDSIGNLSRITSINLSSNNFSGQLPNAVWGLPNLTHLYLTDNYFFGQIPPSLTNMSRIISLGISSNALTGPLPSRKGHGLQHLREMHFSENTIQGVIPQWLFTLPLLHMLDLSSNRLTGPIGKLSSETLSILVLSNNRLNIELESFYNLTNIYFLDISHNTVTERNGDGVNVTFPNLESLHMSSCEITNFPKLLQGSTPSLKYLVLSNNSIRTWFTSNPLQTLEDLDLSSNFLTYARYLPSQSLRYLDLHSNSLQGKYPSSVCNMSELYILNLSDNHLSGNIPECLPNLGVLDLKRNEFHEKIPTTIGDMYGLANLGLNGNHLEGTLPPSLANCTELEVIDLGNNMFNDTFPWWLHTLPQLKILILKSNSFHSSIISPAFTNDSFNDLHIFDLSYNKFTGLLPEKLFASLKAIKKLSQVSPENEMYMRRDSFYMDSVTLSVKGEYVSLTKVLKIFTTIDLSSNNFNGSIPESLSNLTSLRLLNLSHNNINGNIPPALSHMTYLEQLDLSNNQLTGGIPQSLTNLTFLGVLDLSHNHLVGPIPQGNQFLTFSNESYTGNLGLFGAPLTRNYGVEIEPPSAGDFEEEDDDDGFMMGFTWKVVVMGYGCGIVLGFILGNVMISMKKPRWLAKFVYVEAAIILRRRNKRRRMVQGRR